MLPRVVNPKAILNFMTNPEPIPGLTRANVSSHLQKYRNRVAVKKQTAMNENIEDEEAGENVANNEPYLTLDWQ